MNIKYKNQSSGFTLVELAIVLLILGLLLAGLASMLMVYSRNAAIHTTQTRLDTIDEAIQHYLNMNGRLPCPASRTAPPDSDTFGREVAADCTSGAHAGTSRATGRDGRRVRIGFVPTRTINLPDDYALDRWGNRITYAVTEVMASSGTYDREMGAISAIDSMGNSVVTPAGSIHYVLISHGPDSAGAYTAQGSIGRPCSSVTLDAENCNGTATFRRTVLSGQGGSSGHFDDLIIIRAVSAFGEAMPPGAVMAFNLAACPPGWVDYSAASGRTIVGTGGYNEPGFNHDYTVGETGGFAQRRQTLTEQGFQLTEGVITSGSFRIPHRPLGLNPAYMDIRQPFIALRYCQKT